MVSLLTLSLNSFYYLLAVFGKLDKSPYETVPIISVDLRPLKLEHMILLWGIAITPVPLALYFNKKISPDYILNYFLHRLSIIFFPGKKDSSSRFIHWFYLHPYSFAQTGDILIAAGGKHFILFP